MTAVLDRVVITEPGVYDIPDRVYHSDPVPGGSLSASGAKTLLDCPAKFDHGRRNPPEPKAEYDLGHVGHRLVLGVGADIVVVDAESWQTKAAQRQRKEARAAGKAPVLAAEFEQAKVMAAKLREHPIAAALLHPERGWPERSLFWTDAATGVSCRARLDWLPRQIDGRPFAIADYKTTTCASPEAIAKAVHNYDYHLSAAVYAEAVDTLGLADDPGFLFIFQERTPPFVVTVTQLDLNAARIGRERWRRALDVYARCTAEDRWPGYADDIVQISLPAYAERAHDNPDRT